MDRGKNWVSTDFYCHQRQMFKWEVKSKDLKNRTATIYWTLGTDTNDIGGATYYVCHDKQQLWIDNDNTGYDLVVDVGSTGIHNGHTVYYGFTDRGSWLDKTYNPNGVFEDFNGDFVGIHRWVGIRGWVWKSGTFKVNYNDDGTAKFRVKGSFAWYTHDRRGFEITFEIPSIKPAKYAISYKANKPLTKLTVSNIPPNTSKVHGNEYVLPKKEPEIDGYKFDYWTDGLNGSTHYKAGSVFNKNKNTTFYAHWSKIPTYKYTFDVMGGKYGNNKYVNTIEQSINASRTWSKLHSNNGIFDDVVAGSSIRTDIPFKLNAPFKSWVSSRTGNHYKPNNNKVIIDTKKEKKNTTFKANYAPLYDLDLVKIQSIASDGTINYNKSSYKLTKDTGILNKSYYDRSKNLDYSYSPVNPYSLDWYELTDSGYILTGDTVMVKKSGGEYKTYYEYKVNQTRTGYEYLPVSPDTQDIYEVSFAKTDDETFKNSYYYSDSSLGEFTAINPQAMGWYNAIDGVVGEFEPTTDNEQVKGVTYFDNNGLPIIPSICEPQLYESIYSITEDESFNANKVYYTKSSTDKYKYYLVSPNARQWKQYLQFEEMSPVTETMQEGLEFTGVDYYDKIENNYILTNPKENGWYDKISNESYKKTQDEICKATTYFVKTDITDINEVNPKKQGWYEIGSSGVKEPTSDTYIINSEDNYKTYLYLDEELEWQVVDPAYYGLKEQVSEGVYKDSVDTRIEIGKQYFIEEVSFDKVFPYEKDLYIKAITTKYDVSPDTVIKPGSIYYQGLPVVTRITPIGDSWYESGASSVYKRLSNDVRVQYGMTYFLKNKNGQYSKLTLNPKSRGWLVPKVTTSYISSKDTNIVKSKVYYYKSGNSYYKVVLNPKARGWYEKVALKSPVPSNDTTIQAGTTYYMVKNGEYVEINRNPYEAGWWKATSTGKIIKVPSTETSYISGTVYYIHNSDGTNIKIAPKNRGWYQRISVTEYRLTTDSTVEASKVYYYKEGAEYIKVTPHNKSWYIKQTSTVYVLSTHTRVHNNTVYYRKNKENKIVAVNPHDLAWYEEYKLPTYKVSTDTSIKSNKKYYKIINGKYTLVNPSQLLNCVVKVNGKYIPTTDNRIKPNTVYYYVTNVPINPSTQNLYEIKTDKEEVLRTLSIPDKGLVTGNFIYDAPLSQIYKVVGWSFDKPARVYWSANDIKNKFVDSKWYTAEDKKSHKVTSNRKLYPIVVVSPIYVYYNGRWRRALPYIYYNEAWQSTTPYMFSDNNWR